MATTRAVWICLLGFSTSCLPICTPAAPGTCQAAEPAEKPAQHQHQHAHQMNLPSGASDKCEPQFTYEAGPHGPDSWGGVCKTGQAQSPIDIITETEKKPSLSFAPLEFHYQPADLDMVNDCNHHLIKVRFPENLWLKVSRKPYRLSQIVFHAPGEHAVNGKRPPMSLQLVHLSPEGTILIIEVPIVVGKENSVIKALWEHIPDPGKERVTQELKVNAMDLLPPDRGYYSYRGSLTSPMCNEGVAWFVLKNSIEMSEPQIAEYQKHYHNTARPLQLLGQRPVTQSN